MLTILEERRDALVRLCEEYAVSRLEIFGSATSERFDPERSDLDFLVEFRPHPILNGASGKFAYLVDAANTAALRRKTATVSAGFLPDAPLNVLAQYFDCKEALETLFGYSVDLVMIGALKNPYFIQGVNETRKLLYAA